MKKVIPLIILFFSLACGLAFAQNSTNQTDWNTFTITTYYPSPHGVYNRMEIKRALSVGNFTDAPSGLGSVLDLDGGQLFVGESMILKSQASSNPPDGLAGQLIYVNNTATNERMLKFHNGTAWVNATGCPIGKQCYTTNSDESCLSGKRCYTPDSDESCSSGKTCQVSGTTIYGGMYNFYSSYNFYTGKWDASTDGSCPSSYNYTEGTTYCSYPYAQMMSSQSGPYDCVYRCFAYTTPRICIK